MTKYGPVKTDYILFIAAGAFHVSKVEDLIPELQGSPEKTEPRSIAAPAPGESSNGLGISSTSISITVLSYLPAWISSTNFCSNTSFAVSPRSSRYRRSMLSPELMDEITPKNIIMKGPTGVGKTEIARRLAKLVKAPFLKVEATKYTEVGYVGRDVESMVRDLAECAIRLVKEEKTAEVSYKA